MVEQEDPDSDPETLEEKLKLADDHRERAEGLTREVSTEIKGIVEEQLPFESDLKVHPAEDSGFTVEIPADEIISNIGEEMVDEGLSVTATTGLKLFVSDVDIGSERDRIKNLKQLIGQIEETSEEGAPVDEVLLRARSLGMDQSKAEHEIEKLKQKGEVYEPRTDHLRTT